MYSVLLTLTMLHQKESSLHLSQQKLRLITLRLNLSRGLIFLGLWTRYSLIFMTDMNQSMSLLLTIVSYQQWVSLDCHFRETASLWNFSHMAYLLFNETELWSDNSFWVNCCGCAQYVYHDHWKGRDESAWVLEYRYFYVSFLTACSGCGFIFVSLMLLCMLSAGSFYLVNPLIIL